MSRALFRDEHLGDDSAAFVDARAKQTPIKRMGTAWDTAYAALFLASDEAAYVTGTETVVDGGVSAVSAEPAG
jgi:NAD(P)-dependent dehydrogenase (short-subunit alcohol dehydrogenase family)